MMNKQRTLLMSKQRPLLMSKQLCLILSLLPRDLPDLSLQLTLWSSCPLTTPTIARPTPDLDTLLIPDL